MKHKDILVIGGAGFVGRHLVAALAARGARVTVPARQRERAKHLLMLPTVDVVSADVNDPKVLSQLVKGRDAVVNLAGVLHSRRGRPDERGPNDYGPDFARAHVELPQSIISACREHGVKRVLHMSALGAHPHGPSEYLRSKGIGEGVVLAAEDVVATVFRPSVIFGPEDRFLNLFATLATISPALILICPEARFQPVYVGDVVRAFISALDDRDPAGMRHDLCGPRVYTMRELAKYVCDVTGRRRLFFDMPDWLAQLEARLWELTPFPVFTRDNLASMTQPSTSDETMPYGIRPVSMESMAPTWLTPASPREHYTDLRFRARR